METKKKKRFLIFCFFLFPGAAEMYMGFMKTGVSLMSLFFLVAMLSVWMGQGVLAMAIVVIWFYGFFHANHLAGLTDEDFVQIKDEYLFGMDGIPGVESFVKKYHKWIAVILILLGASMLWNSVAQVMANLNFQLVAQIMWKIGNYIPSFAFGVAIIFAGVKMISGKKATLAEQQDVKQDAGDMNLNMQEENTNSSQEGK